MRNAVWMAFLLAACVSSGTKVSEDQASRFVAGKTTYDEVIQALGRPNSIAHVSDGTTSIAYVYVASSPKAATFIPIVGIFAGGANAETTTATFSFGPDKILRSSSSSASQTSAGMFGGVQAAPGPTPAPQ